MKDWDDEFGPSFTPEQMIKLGIFNGVYDNRPPDSTNNHFGVTANMNIKVRIDGVLVTKPNLSFWFEWYRGYYDGIRTDKDTWYIKNWKTLVHTLSNKEPSDKYSQQLLQLGWDNLQEFTDDNVYSNVAIITGRKLATEGFGVNQATDLLKLGVGVYEITKQVQSLNTGTKSSRKKKRGGGKFSISPTMNPLAYLPYVTVEEKDGFVTVTGFSTKQFANGLDRLLKTSRFKNIFTSMSSRSFVVESFFVIEVIRSIDLLLSNGSNMSNGSLESLKEKLITNTWVGGLKDAEPRKFNYDRLSRLTVSLLPKQMQFLNEYETVTPLLGLNGWLLAAAPGSGKTISGFSWHLVNEFDCTIFVVPNNSVEKVWENTILTFFKDNPKYFISRDGFKIKGDEEFIVCHYEYLEKLLTELPKVKAKRIGLWVDESHNFNELTSQRTNNLIYISQTYAEATVEASGTPLKHKGKELVPLFRMIDKLFTPTVEASFIKTFGSTTGTVLELLNYRANRASFKVSKEEVFVNVINERSIAVKIPDPTPYHLDTVMSEIRVFCKEKLVHYQTMKPSIEVEYFKFIDLYKNNCKDIGDFATYISGTKEMHTKFSPYTHIELIKQCSKYEKEYILPFLHPTDRKVFKKASALYKYPILVVRGQALGRILTRRRIECSVAMVPYAGIEDIVTAAKKKTVIFTNHVDVVIAIGDHLKVMGIKPILVYGDTNKDLSDNLARFLKDPKANPIVATYNSLSTAVPLIEASSIYLHDSPFRQYIIEQAIARLDRYGQDSDVDVLRGALDTGEIPNLSTRSIDIAAISKEMVDAILDIGKVDDRMLSAEGFGYPDEVDGCAIKDEYTFDSVLTSESFYESHSDRHTSNWGDDRDKLFTIMLNNSREMYHVSFDELPRTLKPRLPDGSENGNKSHHSYEPDIKRVCFSDSVIGAIRAVYPNYQRMFERDKPDPITWKLYKVAVGTKGQWVPPHALTEAGFVDDAHITREYWNMVDVSPVYVGDIDVHMDFDNGCLKYKPFDKGNRTINHSPIDIVVDYTNTKLSREDYSATSGGVFTQPLKPLYIASMVELKSDTLSPEYPSGSKFAKQRKAKDSFMYDAAEERVAAHGSICGAVRSLWADNRDIVEVHGSGFPIYVYEVNRPNMYDWVSPSELSRNRAVWDANITHVYWTHETVKLSSVEECWAEWEVDGQWAFIQINGDEQTMEHSPLTLRVVRKDGTVESDRSKNHNSIDISGYNLRLEV